MSSMKKYQRLISGTFISIMLIICALAVPFGKYISADIMSDRDIKLICYVLAFIIPGSTVFSNALKELREKKYKAVDFYATVISVVVFCLVNEIAAIGIIVVYAFVKQKYTE